MKESIQMEMEELEDTYTSQEEHQKEQHTEYIQVMMEQQQQEVMTVQSQ